MENSLGHSLKLPIVFCLGHHVVSPKFFKLEKLKPELSCPSYVFCSFNFCRFQYACFKILLKTLASSFGMLISFFVCFSELLYPEGSISPNSGIAADILCKGRDYLVRPTLLYLQNMKKVFI